MRYVEGGEAPLQIRFIGVLQAVEAAQPGDVLVCVGGVVDRFRPGVARQELQAVRVSLFGDQLQRVIDGIGNELRFRANRGELRIGNQQPTVLNLLVRQDTVGVERRADFRRTDCPQNY